MTIFVVVIAKCTISKITQKAPWLRTFSFGETFKIFIFKVHNNVIILLFYQVKVEKIRKLKKNNNKKMNCTLKFY